MPRPSLLQSTRYQAYSTQEVGPGLRRWLSRVDSQATLGRKVGEDALGVSDERDAVIERKVALPARWLACFLEIQAVPRRLERDHALNRPAALRALRSLPLAVSLDGQHRGEARP